MTDFNIRTANLRAINSLTKYPSIPTYHALDPKNGGLLDECIKFPGAVIATEKVDGTNGRVIFLPDGTYLIGSREHLLYAKGDLIGDPALGIVEALKPVAEAVDAHRGLPIQVLYLEVYGGKVTAASKHYTRTGQVSVRLFDSAVIGDLDERLTWPSERIASWRENGGQAFLNEEELGQAALLSGVQLAPRLLDEFYDDAMPATVGDMYAMLQDLAPHTRVGLDHEGAAEGIVFRSPDRSVIAKARFQDYERTLKRRGGGRG